MTGTEGAMRRASATQDQDLPAVVVTGSIAEMIGGGVTPEGSNLLRFLPRTIDEDQWQSADRAIYWLWSEFGAKKAEVRGASRCGRGCEAPGQHHRADLRHLQHAVGPARDPAPGRGDRLRGQSRLPARLAHRGRAASSPTPTSMSACIASSAASSARSSEALSAGADRDVRDHQLPAQAGRADRRRSRAVHRAREAHDDQADLGSVAQRDPGLLRHRLASRSWRPRPTSAACGSSSRTRWACPARSRSRARPASSRTTTRSARRCRDSRRWCCSAPTTSACIRQSWRAARIYIPASFPGAIIRRATGTPFMGYAGATYIVQEVCNALFDALFNILPLGTELDRVDATPARAAPHEPPGTTMRRTLLDGCVERSRSWCGSRRPSGCATGPSATRCRPVRTRSTAARWRGAQLDRWAGRMRHDAIRPTHRTMPASWISYGDRSRAIERGTPSGRQAGGVVADMTDRPCRGRETEHGVPPDLRADFVIFLIGGIVERFLPPVARACGRRPVDFR